MGSLEIVRGFLLGEVVSYSSKVLNFQRFQIERPHFRPDIDCDHQDGADQLVTVPPGSVAKELAEVGFSLQILDE
jgi:hypothetical protein